MKLSNELEITEEDVEITKILFRYARQYIELAEPDFMLTLGGQYDLTEERILNHLTKQVSN